MEYAALVKTALDCGADKAEVIDPSKIVCSNSFRAYCEANVCGFYGRCWSCPPDIGNIDDLIQELKTYSHAMLYQTISRMENSTDTEELNAATEKLSDTSQKLQLCFRTLFRKPFLHLAGSCHLCRKCAKIADQPCRFPDKMLPAMSAYGIDVCGTCASTSLRYMNGENTVTFFGMVLFDE